MKENIYNREYTLNKMIMHPFIFKLYLFKIKIKEFRSKLKKYRYESKLFSYDGSYPQISFKINTNVNSIQLGYLIFKLPFFRRERKRFEISYNFAEDLKYSIIIIRGEKYKFINLPHGYDWVRTSQLKKDGTWVHETKGNRQEFHDHKKWDGVFFEEVHDYTYVLNSGKIQKVKATVTISEREWRRKFLKWTKMFSMVRTTLDVSFSNEVGEMSGSWKGGVCGCSYNIKEGETPLETLRRMEKERKFE